jgi:hypothetical protein
MVNIRKMETAMGAMMMMTATTTTIQMMMMIMMTTAADQATDITIHLIAVGLVMVQDIIIIIDVQDIITETMEMKGDLVAAQVMERPSSWSRT